MGRLLRYFQLALPFLIFSFLTSLVVSIYVSIITFPDFQQGEYSKIMFIHVPAAWLSLLCYFLLGVYSLLYIVKRLPVFDILARVNACLGFIFTLCTLITGSLWGKPIWGTYWVWDARLTSVLFLAFIYLGYFVLRRFSTGSAYKTVSLEGAVQEVPLKVPVFAILGLLNLPIIRMSVVWWTTLHQKSSITQVASSVDISYVLPIYFFLGTFLLFSWIITLYFIQQNMLLLTFRKWCKLQSL